ncbi:MAG: hypothetical protein JW810_09860, partial [Sedimentisphaerales bacterium]|nr:hypothetical protein [Sedimentisphaerales bacterium]
MALCPHCEKELTLADVNADVSGSLKKEVMYSCPYCRKILGFAYFLGGLLTGRPERKSRRQDH